MKLLNMKIMSRIEDFLTRFEVDLFSAGKIMCGPCPIHDGDNVTAFNINIDSQDEFYGAWFCNTNGCHTIYGNDPLAFIRCMLDKTSDQKLNFHQVLDFVNKITSDVDIEVDDIFINNSALNKLLIKKAKVHKPQIKITKDIVRSRLQIPAQYYIDKGFESGVLDLFDVGLCTNPDAEMYNRVVFPVYDENNEYMVGSVGRTVVDHPQKWKNQKGFNTANYLYNFGRAYERIKKTNCIVLVEGQGDVIRLWETGVYNVVGMFGSSLTESQEYLVQKSGAFTIVVITDNDEAGHKCRKKINEDLKTRYNIINIIPPKNDVGEMTHDDIHNIIKPQMKGSY